MSFENDTKAATAPDAREKVQNALASARDCTTDALSRGTQCMRERPATALLAAFGVGLLAGVALAAALSSGPRRRPTLADSFDDSKERLAELIGAAAGSLRGPLRKTYSNVSGKAGCVGGAVADTFGRLYREGRQRWK